MSDELISESPAKAFGRYINSLRDGMKMSQRAVEQASGNEISNAYLSQLENGKIAKPSPHIIHTLAEIYNADYAKLMERAGYISPSSERRSDAKHGRAATFSIDHLTTEEEKELLEYLAFIRNKRKDSD